MKPSERLRARVQEIQNNVYARLRPGMKKGVNKTYRLKKRVEPKVQTRAQQGRRDLSRLLLGSSKGLRKWTIHNMGEGPPRRRRRRVVVGK